MMHVKGPFEAISGIFLVFYRDGLPDNSRNSAKIPSKTDRSYQSNVLILDKNDY